MVWLDLQVCINFAGPILACVASISVRFKSKERGTRVKDRAKNGV